jgi:hypothetical protein
MDGAMAERVWLLVVPAVTLAACDLIVKAGVPASHEVFHHRSGLWIAASSCIVAGSVALLWVPSRAVSLFAGVASGGVLGNLVSARWWDAGVPNPFLYETAHATIAFNLADVCIVGGVLLLMVALVETTIRNRHVLPEATVAVRLARHARGRIAERRAEAEAARAEAEAAALAAVREVEPFWELGEP